MSGREPRLSLTWTAALKVLAGQRWAGDSRSLDVLFAAGQHLSCGCKGNMERVSPLPAPCLSVPFGNPCDGELAWFLEFSGLHGNYSFFFNFFNLLILERGRGREGQRNIDLLFHLFIHLLVDSLTGP